MDIWKEAIGRSLLTKEEKQILYAAFLRPQLVYPLGCTTIDDIDLKRLLCPVLDTILHTLGLNKYFPLALVHAGPSNLELDIDDLPTVQGTAQLQLLLGHINK